MEISYRWLQTFFDEPLPEAKELARLLTTHAYEVEEVRETAFGPVLAIDVLPNRGHDSLSHVGVAKEVAVLLDRPVVLPTALFAGQTDAARTAELVSLEIPNDGLVRRASKRLIRGVHVAPAPEWMQKRLAAIGQRPINNIVDATNYVTFEMGQPVHAFDYDKIAGTDAKNIYIRHARADETIILLDGNEYTLDPSMLVIADDEGPLDIAGIKGGMRAAIDEHTTNVLLSVCNFDPTSIRKTGDLLKLHTDAAKRFKQEITPELVAAGMDRLTVLVAEATGGTPTADILDHYPERPALTELLVTAADVNALLGTILAETDIEHVLTRMERAGFTFHHDGATFTVTIPHERLDLMNPGRGEWSGGNAADLIEEIGRIVGYDHIAGELPERVAVPTPLKSYYYTEVIRHALLGAGFNEVLTYSFVDEGDVHTHVEIENPPAENKKFLRHRLMYLLEQKLNENMPYADLLGTDPVAMFEIGRVFTREREWLSLGIVARYKNGKNADTMIAGGIDFLASALAIDAANIKPMRNTCGVEIDLTALFERLPEQKSYESLPMVPASRTIYVPFSSYPFICRDIAVWLPETADPAELEAVIRAGGTALLTRVDLFDSFTKTGRTSYAYRLVFQARDRTLTDDEVNRIMAPIYAEAASRHGWEVR